MSRPWEMLRWITTAQQGLSAPLIRLLVSIRPGSNSPDGDGLDDIDMAERLAVVQVSAALCALQPGGPSISWPMSSYRQVTVVVCGKANAAAGYKALAANATKLGYKLGDVKSTVVVAPMQYEDLQRTAETAVSHALHLKGWNRLGPMWVRGDFLAAAPGRTAIVAATELSVQPASASTATMALGFMNTGMYKFCPVWPPRGPADAAADADASRVAMGTKTGSNELPQKGEDEWEQQGLEAEAAREAELAGLFADKAALRRALSRLSEARVTVVGPGTPACIIGLKPPPSNAAAAQRLRDTWLARFGLRLPERLGGFVAEVVASPEADPDEAVDVPGCCLWAANGGGGIAATSGLVAVPPSQCPTRPEQVADQLVADLVLASAAGGCSFPFWGPVGLTPRSDAPPGAEAALAKLQAGLLPPLPPPRAGEARADSAMPARTGGENTGWTVAVEVAASGFRAAAALAPEAHVLRRTIDPDIHGDAAGSAYDGAVNTELEAARCGREADMAARAGGSADTCYNAILQRSSDEALRAAAELRAANRAREKAFWRRYQAFREARKEEDVEGHPSAPSGTAPQQGRGRTGGGGGAGGGLPRVPQFGSSALGLSRPTSDTLRKGAAARPLLKAVAGGKKTTTGTAQAAGKAAGASKAPARATGIKPKAARAAKTPAAAAAEVAGADADVSGQGVKCNGTSTVAPKPASKRSTKAASAGADGAGRKKRARDVEPVAAAGPAPAAVPAAACDAVVDVQLPPVEQYSCLPLSAAVTDGAANVAADNFNNENDADDFVQLAPTAAATAAVAKSAPKKCGAAGKSLKAASGKRSAAMIQPQVPEPAGGAAGGGPAAAEDSGIAAVAMAATATATAGAEAAAPAAKEARKRVKASALDLATVQAKVSAAAASGRLSDLTLPEMQCWLRAHKAPVSGKKADVEARLAALLVTTAAPAATATAAAVAATAAIEAS